MGLKLQPTPKGVDQSDAEVGLDLFDQLKDTQGRFRTQSLFYELRNPNYPAYFTLKKEDIERDGIQYISLYKKYMEIADPTEYQVALRLLGSWDHWQGLCKTQWFKEHLTGWREELKVKMESDRYFEMVGKVSEDGPQAIQATRWLAERYTQDEPKRGRPTKAEKEAHLKRVAQSTAEDEDDAARIGLS